MGRISSFVTGAALGVIAALLLAPQTGEQTRALVAEKANAVTGEAKDFGAAPAAPAASVADDELREKIEAARQRIAAQVAANAEATKAAAEEVQEAVAE